VNTLFDVYYIGENSSLCEHIPFAQRIDSEREVEANTKMFWLIEPNVELLNYDVLEYRPPDHDQVYTHIWKWDNNNYGGIKLMPRSESQGIKEVNRIVCRKRFDIVNTKTPGKYFDRNPYATHVWCVDPEYKLNDHIDWAPDNFEPKYIHSFHLRNQLEHKYPELEGGIKLYPREWQDANIKYHGFLDAGVEYPVIWCEDVDDYTQRDVYSEEYVWIVDREYQLQSNTLDWVPNPFEDQMIHSFRMPNQLTEKYPKAMGGIRLVPKKWKNADLKVHQDCPIEDINYDVFYIDSDEFTADTYTEYAQRSRTEWFWMVDRNFRFNGKLLYVPAKHEQEYIHVFKLPGHLDFRYPENITEPYDSRCGGIRLVHRDFDITKQKYHAGVTPLKYDVFRTNNVTQFETYAKKSRTKMFWMVDSGYRIDQLDYVPDFDEQTNIINFKLSGQLTEKYPDKEGGIYLVPRSNPKEAPVVHRGELRNSRVEYEVFHSQEEGREKTSQAWFWVVDPNVDVMDDFSFNYVPEVWDEGKTHVWQKLNPKTQRQYDYGGVMLCPREPKTKGRPKYIREPASVHKTYPTYYLDNREDIVAQLEKFEASTDVDMYWVVDPFVKLDEDFDFDYYPTQWDANNVHVFSTSADVYTGVRLYPKGTYAQGHEYTTKEINNNSFPNLKLINTVASTTQEWPIYHITEFKRDEFLEKIQEYKQQGYDYMWTVDPDVEEQKQVVKSGFVPEITNINKIHVWQKINPTTEKVHGYGGLRLWPTHRDYSETTSDDLRLNRFKQLQYMQTPGCTYKSYEIVFISYHEPGAETAYKRLTQRFDTHWIKDVEGIFEAHKQAAMQVQSTMFWVVDADAEVSEDFDFSYIPDVYDQEVTHVWNARNPLTGHEYGYGGIKLFNTEQVRDATSWGLDFTTGLSSRFKAMPEISCTTKFNTDGFSTWRSAFRECVKLSMKDDEDSRVRLQSWLFPIPGVDYREEAKAGAQAGIDYAEANANKPMRLAKINDYEWLKEQYDEYQHNIK
jgi:hypothetical protein